MASKIRPNGFWHEWGNVEEELSKVIEELGHFPSQKELKQMRKSYLTGAMRHHGGAISVRERMGYSLGNKERHYWKNIDNVVRELRGFMEEQGLDRTPTQKEMYEAGRSDLAVGITRNHGLEKVRKIIGEESGRVNRNQWKNLDFVVEKAHAFLEEHGLDELPAPREIARLGYSSFVSAVCSYHGGFPRLREILGHSKPRIENGKLKDFDYVVSEVKRIMKEENLSTVPTQNQFSELGHGSITYAITTYHGGLRKLREFMQLEQVRREDGLLEDRDYVIQEAERIMGEHGLDQLPTQKQFYEFGESSLGHAISTFHGGLRDFRKFLRERKVGYSEGDELERLLENYSSSDDRLEEVLDNYDLGDRDGK